LSTEYLTLGERLTAAYAGLEELIRELIVKCGRAHYLIADLQTLLAQAGIHEPTQPEIAQRVATLRLLFADHAVPDDCEPPSVAEIVEEIRYGRGVEEE
jgi:hypothetical protein